MAAARLAQEIARRALGRYAVAIIGESNARLGNDTLAADARRVLELNDPGHPWLRGDNWPDYPWVIRRLNPFAGEKSPLGD